MKVLIACEESQEVCKAFRALGHEAYSCDIQEPSGGHPEWHILGDAVKLAQMPISFFKTMDGKEHCVEWDLLIAHPPCTYLSNAGARHLWKDHQLQADRVMLGIKARDFFMEFYRSPIPLRAAAGTAGGGGVMERLTDKREADAQREEYARHLANGYPRDIYVERLLRLAAYEDTGIEPKEVSELVKDWSDLCTIIGECGGLDRVRVLDEADKDGRLSVLPCKVGDTVYRIVRDADPHITRDEVRNIYFADDMTLCVELVGGRIILSEKFGKTVFLTREAAEKALEAMEDE